MPLLSIIIPCYNAAKYIDNCFQSLENQTIGIKNLEIIFVNDASTDNTLTYLMDFEQKYPENVLIRVRRTLRNYHSPGAYCLYYNGSSPMYLE